MPPARNSHAVQLVVGSTRSTARLTSKVLLQTQQVEDRRRRQERYEANISGLTESLLTCSMNLLQEDKHNRYLSDEELDAILPATGYAIVTPLPGYAPMEAPHKLMGPSVTEVAAGADDTMGAVDDDFQWETVPADLRHNEMFALAVWDVLVVGDIIFNVLASS
ncbi:hypothetical protein EDB19DRAFT_1939170 [Suillus lakei]|nr:hypothetical protein EDB19DRAFT_1939170 [Suillus lakei]